MTESSELDRLQARLDYRFRDPRLLERALEHPSFHHAIPGATRNNQRLEFLGDAVLQFIVTERLCHLFPDDREGALTKRRAALTKGAFLVGMARELDLDACLRMGASEEASGGRTKAAALEDAFEALIGALHLDGGLAEASRVVLDLYGDIAARLAAVEHAENPKGRLQEMMQPEHGNHALRYDLVEAKGSHHARQFEVAVLLNGRVLGTGRGTSKKLAEEAAAAAALEALDPPKT